MCFWNNNTKGRKHACMRNVFFCVSYVSPFPVSFSVSKAGFPVQKVSHGHGDCDTGCSCLGRGAANVRFRRRSWKRLRTLVRPRPMRFSRQNRLHLQQQKTKRWFVVAAIRRRLRKTRCVRRSSDWTCAGPAKHVMRCWLNWTDTESNWRQCCRKLSLWSSSRTAKRLAWMLWISDSATRKPAGSWSSPWLRAQVVSRLKVKKVSFSPWAIGNSRGTTLKRLRQALNSAHTHCWVRHTKSTSSRRAPSASCHWATHPADGIWGPWKGAG